MASQSSKGKGKGHRQRGAGTIIVAPPPVITEDGIKIAPHMRLPSTMLQEFCQKEKLPKPLYDRCDEQKGKFRVKVTILDPRNRRKDLEFLPTQSCSSEKMARDYSALLALLQFQRTLPLERKLPEPYRTTWLDMISNSNENLCHSQDGESSESPVVVPIELRNQYELSSIVSNELKPNHKSAELSNAERFYAEQVQAANAPQFIELTPKMRKYLTNYCKLIWDEEFQFKDLPTYSTSNLFLDNPEYSTALLTLHHVLFPDTINDGLNISDIFTNLSEKITRELFPLVFHQRDINFALSLTFQEIFASFLFSEISFVNLKSLVLEHLCLIVDEASLPNALKVRSSHEARSPQVFVPHGRILELNDCVSCSPIFQLLSSYGWSRQHVELALSQVTRKYSSTIEFDRILQDSLTLLVQATCRISESSSHEGLNWIGSSNVDTPRNTRHSQALKEEIDVLQAIYGEDICVNELPGSDILVISITKFIPTTLLPSFLSHWKTKLVLETYIFSRSTYPFDCPISLVRCPSISSECSYLLSLQKALLERIRILVENNNLEEGIIFQLDNFVNEWIDGATQSTTTTCLPLNSDIILQHLAGEIQELSHQPGRGVEIPVPLCKSRRSHSFWGNKLASPCPVIIRPEITEIRQQLPAWQVKESSLKLLRENLVLIVTGETGCGKTTQIPQFMIEADPRLKVVVCQPRRLAAVGVATRVAWEQNSAVGEIVGHSVKRSSQVSDRTRLLFCTYGILLIQLQLDKLLSGIDIIILDEIHERGIESDFVLALVLKTILLRFQEVKRKPLKLIIMSATIQTNRFSSYIIEQLSPISLDFVPVLHIPGKLYPVRVSYLETIRSRIRESPLGQSPHDNDSIEKIKVKNLKRADGIPYRLMILTVFLLSQQSSDTGAFLIFLPGIAEIFHFISLFENLSSRYVCVDKERFVLLPLHGSLSTVEQSKVFNHPPRGIIKIVVATNIAEASITIPDVAVVLDSCLVKEMSRTSNSKVSSLNLVWASKDNLQQRTGRAGRVREGQCFRFITQDVFEKEIPQHCTPEILRASVESLVLQLRVMFTDDSVENSLLYSCVDPPSRESVTVAETSLMSIGALYSSSSLVGKITSLGLQLSRLPCDTSIGKMLIYGAIFKCISTISAIAACIASKDPFMSSSDPPNKVKIASAKAMLENRFTEHGGKPKIHSDLLVMAEIVRQYRSLETVHAKKEFCNNMSLNFYQLEEILLTQEEYVFNLIDISFIQTRSLQLLLNERDMAPENENSSKTQVVVAVVCAALYPSVCYIHRPPKKYVETIGGSHEQPVSFEELRFFVQSQNISEPKIVEGECKRNLEQELLGGMCEVYAASGSILASSKLNYNYLLYAKMYSISNNQVFVKDLSEITPYALLLFAGKYDVDYLNGTVTLDNYLRFSTCGRVAALFARLRKSIEILLQKKIDDPLLIFQRNRLVTALITLLTSDDS